MQLLAAGPHQFVLLEYDPDIVRQGAEETGFACTISDRERAVLLELSAVSREGPLLLFDASEPSNMGWFSRCQFYVDALSGTVLQTPFSVANCFDTHGRPLPKSLKLQIRKELPAHYRLPGRQPLSEKVVYGVLFNFLNALLKTGVGVCGSGPLRPLAGRIDAPTR
jgi:hypothetical protein